MILWKQLIEDESAVTMTHYAMLIALISVAAVGAMNVFMTSVGGMAGHVGEVFDAI